MTINFYDAVDADGLFNVLGKVFHAQATANTARGTTVPTEVVDVFTIFNNLTATADLEATISALPASLTGFQASGAGLLSGLQSFARQYLIETVNADSSQPDRTLGTAMRELIRQMVAEGKTVDASTVAASVAYGAANIGTGRLVLSTKRGDGKIQENLIAETMAGECLSAGANASFQLRGQAAALNSLDHDWPRGSGVGTSVSAISAASSLLANGDFEDEDDLANAPDDWHFPVGTIGTTVKMTDVEVQTVAISGTPTGGYYRLLWTNADGKNAATAMLAFNAGQSAVQAALRAIPGLESVTVATTGTTPNLTHTVTFTGRGGDVSQLTSDNRMTGGTPVITHNTTAAGSPYVFAGGKAVEFDSNGSQLTVMQQRLTTLEAFTAYAVSLWAIADVVPAAGRITVDLVDGVSGSVIRDAAGMLNSFRFSCTDLSASSWKHTTQLVSAVNEVQTLTITGTPTGGNFTLTFDGQTTGNIAYNANAAAVQSALEALSNIAVGDVTCGGGALPGTPVTITFTGRLAARRLPEITANSAGLTGGTTPTATIATTTDGSPAEPVFRMPAVIPELVYFRIRISTAISAGTSVFLDHAALARMSSLYPGGPLAALFGGSKNFARGDTMTLTTTNDRAGLLQEWFARNFDMPSLGLLLPSDTGGAETIPDSVVS